MRIIQVIDGYKKGDGVGNVVAAMDEFLKKTDFDTLIYDRQLEYSDVDSELFGEDTIVFYHLALLVDPIIKYLRCKKVLVFHNITAPELLERADEEMRIWASAGLYDTAKTASYFDAAITFSGYSRKCLIEMGWKAEDITVLPIIVRFNRFTVRPSEEIIERYKGNSINILFTGRVYPNKKQEDIIAAFALYKKKYHKETKLFLVGSIGNGKYYPSLLAYAEKLGVADDVVFPGHVTLAEYLAYYHLADMYLCMSAHEGFCIPLVEAMHFEIPVIAHASTAVPDTLAGSGILVGSRNPEVIACVMDKVMSDDAYRHGIIEGQNNRLKQLGPEELEREYIEALKSMINRLKVGDDVKKSERRNDSEYGFFLTTDLFAQIERLSGRCGKYVVYGAGAAGTRLYVELRKSCKKEKLVLCDSYKRGSYDAGLECDIISPEDAVKLYGDSTYIISIQDKKIILEIAAYLLEQGIKKGQILLYDKMSHWIV